MAEITCNVRVIALVQGIVAVFDIIVITAKWLNSIRKLPSDPDARYSSLIL